MSIFTVSVRKIVYFLLLFKLFLNSSCENIVSTTSSSENASLTTGSNENASLTTSSSENASLTTSSSENAFSTTSFLNDWNVTKDDWYSHATSAENYTTTNNSSRNNSFNINEQQNTGINQIISEFIRQFQENASNNSTNESIQLLLSQLENLIQADGSVDPTALSQLMNLLQNNNIFNPEVLQTLLPNLMGNNSDGVFQMLQNNPNFMSMIQGFVPETIRPLVGFMTSLMQIYSPALNTSLACRAQRSIIGQGLMTGSMASMQFFDSMGKLPSGLFTGNTMMIGEYDQCMALDDLVEGQRLKGVYALVVFKIDGLPSMNELLPLQNSGFPNLYMGMCLPKACTKEDVKAIGQNLVASMSPAKAELREFHLLGDKNPSKDGGFVSAMAILAFLAVLCILGTGVELALQTRNQGTDSGDNMSYTVRMLLAFSVIKNTSDLMKAKHSNNDIQCLHGLRVISISWVVLGHGVFFAPQYGNLIFLLNKIKNASFWALINATVSVDTFFVLSGCLVSYLFMAGVKKQGGLKPLHVAMFYVHRYLRLTPLYALVIVVAIGVSPYLTSGPMDIIMTPDYSLQACKDHWWTNLLYINNFKLDQPTCLGWTWYLPNDMQFYFISPLMLIPLALGYKVIGILFIFLLFSTHVVSNSILQAKYHSSMIKNQDHFYIEFYIKPWTRCAPYAVGLAVGYFLYLKKSTLRMNWILVALGWLVSIGVGAALLYMVHDDAKNPLELTWSTTERDVYNVMFRPVWGLCVGWVIIACATGHGGFINSILSWQAWIPLSRLTFGTYLIHPLVFFYLGASRIHLEYFDNTLLVMLFISCFLLSYGLSFVLSLLIETPVRNILRPSSKLWEKKVVIRGMPSKDVCLDKSLATDKISKNHDLANEENKNINNNSGTMHHIKM